MNTKKGVVGEGVQKSFEPYLGRPQPPSIHAKTP